MAKRWPLADCDREKLTVFFCPTSRKRRLEIALRAGGNLSQNKQGFGIIPTKKLTGGSRSVFQSAATPAVLAEKQFSRKDGQEGSEQNG